MVVSLARAGVPVAALALAAIACARDVSIGAELPLVTSSPDGGASGGSTGAGGAPPGEAGAGAGGEQACVPSRCRGQLYACGDCLDNEGDGLVDSNDPDCLGPCHDAEDTFYAPIAGQGGLTCVKECYFDKGRGVGIEGCAGSHVCDPLAPEGPRCAYDPAARECAGSAPQPAPCLARCGPLTPNGCDCLGCCSIPGAPTPVWLGSVDGTGAASCDHQSVGDPSRCRPCTQDPSCLNPCEACELCVGKTTLPPECTGGECPAPECPFGRQPCGLSCLAPCPSGTSCITGCCIDEIR